MVGKRSSILGTTHRGGPSLGRAGRLKIRQMDSVLKNTLKNMFGFKKFKGLGFSLSTYENTMYIVFE